MAGGQYVVQTAATEEVPPPERADYWSELLSGYHRTMTCRYRQGEGFRARATEQRSSRYQLVEWQQGYGIWMDRTAGHIRQDSDEDYRFALPVAGCFLVRQHDQQAHLQHGSAALFTMDHPFQLAFERPTRGLVFTIPRHDVDGRIGALAGRSAVGLDLRVGLGRVVSHMMLSAAEEREALARCQFDAICERVVELLCLLLAGDTQPTAPAHLADVEAMVRRHVREHAADPQLTGQTVARALGWSLRHVQRALHAAGTTPRELIREERLRLARERLQHPQLADQTITEIAHACGFSSPSALSTAFRARFGMSPRDLR